MVVFKPVLQQGIARPLPPLRTGPGDIFKWVFDIAGFAVQTVGRIQFQLALAAFFVNFYFIDIARAKSGAGAAILGIAGVHAKIGVVHNDMRWLIFTVLGFG